MTTQDDEATSRMRGDAHERAAGEPVVLGFDPAVAWPAVSFEEHPWSSDSDYGLSHRARLRSRGPYRAAVPPTIAHLDVPALTRDSALEAEDAVSSLARFDGEYGSIAAPFSAMLLRSESASSSEIEQLTAQPTNIALAELGAKSSTNARLIVANTRAMEAAISLSGDLDQAAIIAMQSALLVDSSPHMTGDWRTTQVWIGGGLSNSPHTASFVPPHHARVPALMADLVAFARRTDLPALPHIAITHAQFETIHPFPDGNGRTGRAIVHSMLHRMGITTNVTVPVSAGLLQDTAGYFQALEAYRAGDVVPIVDAFSRACVSALSNGRQLVADLTHFRSYAEQSTSARRGSAAWRAIDVLVRAPVVDARSLSLELGVTPQNAQAGIDRLVGDGILEQVTEGRRNRYYRASPVLIALDEFAQRARRRRR